MLNHPYLNFSISSSYPHKLVVGTSGYCDIANGLLDKNVKNVENPPYFNGIEVVEIGYRCFWLDNIESVFIPKTIRLIKYAAFANCYKLVDFRFEKGSELQKLETHVFWLCRVLKKIDFPSKINDIGINSVGPFFNEASLDCFSYAGTHDFSSLTYFFGTVTNVYVSNDYQQSSFASKAITKRGETCGVSNEH